MLTQGSHHGIREERIQLMSSSTSGSSSSPLLTGIRVLDLTDHRGEVGPWMLGELGADVIRVEPVGGSSSRAALPLRHGDESDLRSLQFCAYNSNKRSIVVDLGDEHDRAMFLDLVATSDFVYESGVPGVLAEHGIDHEVLSRVNPTIVHVQVTAFGSTGPRANDVASELSIASLGGSVNLQGVRDRPPVKASIPQVWRHAGMEAANAGLVAHARMSVTGESQLVDVSAQAAMTWTLLNAMEASEIQGFDFERSGTVAKLVLTMQLRVEAKDGYVIVIPRGATVAAFLEWLIADGVVDEAWREEDWLTFDDRCIRGLATSVPFEAIHEALCRLLAGYTRDELMRRALELGNTIAPINSVADLLDLDQLAARDYFVPMSMGELEGPVQVPGGHALIGGERIATLRRPPHVGQHGDELRAELAREKSRRDVPARLAQVDLPLEGLKVVDFSWIGVGPITAKALADHGAKVVRVESGGRLDALRLNPPFKDQINDVDMSHFFGTFNTSKLGIDIDLKNPGGLAVARRLIEWADVVIEAWTPGAFARLGFDYESIRELNPKAIVVSTSLLGEGGPLSSMAGYGYHAAALAGFFEVVGWSDLPPDGPYLAYTDTIGPRLITATLLAAIARQRSSGEGCRIEVGQLEAGLHFLTPEFLDLQLNGVLAGRHGNRDADMAPQGTYPCSGEDRWCSVSVADDKQWRALKTVMGRPSWADDPELDDMTGRAARHDFIDDRLAAWTSEFEAGELAHRLVSAGVPAGKVQRSSDLLVDPQYEHRGFYRRLEHSKMGLVPYAGHQFSIEGYDNGPRTAAPMLGEHTFEVLGDVLGLDGDEIADIAATGALG